MTWSVFDDGAPKHPKARAAGNEAWGLWAAAVMYCNRWLTDGRVTLAALANDCLPVPIAPARARKLAEKLCEAKIRPDGVGMFTEAGKDVWDVHDFLEWNKSKAEVEAKRAADRARKRGTSVGTSGQDPSGPPLGSRPDSAGNSVRSSVGVPNGKNEDSASHVRARGRSDPPSPSVPPVPSPPLQSDGGANGRIRCPMPVPVPDDTLNGLAMSPGIPMPVARTFLVTWSAKQNAKAGDTRSSDAWCASAVAALCGEWSKDKDAMREAAGIRGAPVPEDPAATARRAKAQADLEARRAESERRGREAREKAAAEGRPDPLSAARAFLGAPASDEAEDVPGAAQ